MFIIKIIFKSFLLFIFIYLSYFIFKIYFQENNNFEEKNTRLKIFILKEKINSFLNSNSILKNDNVNSRVFILGNKRINFSILDKNFEKTLNNVITELHLAYKFIDGEMKYDNSLLLSEQYNIKRIFNTVPNIDKIYKLNYEDLKSLDLIKKKYSFLKESVLYKLENSSDSIDVFLYNKIKSI